MAFDYLKLACMSEMSESAGVNRGEIVRLLRDRGAAQTDLARAMGISQSALSQLLSGKRSLKGSELPAVASFLGIGITHALRLLGIDVKDAA